MDKQGLKLRCSEFRIYLRLPPDLFLSLNPKICLFAIRRENPACGRNSEFGRNSELQPAEVIIKGSLDEKLPSYEVLKMLRE